MKPPALRLEGRNTVADDAPGSSPAFGFVGVFGIGAWQPQIGDPSVIGWLTVFSYYVCAGLSVACALKLWGRMNRTQRRIRISMAILVVALGISKHLNLPGAVTEVGRMAVKQLGGYEMRRGFQVVMLLLAAVGVILVVRWSTRRKVLAQVWEFCAPEIIGLSFLCSLLILRAISLHQVGALLSARVLGVRIDAIAELACIYTLMLVLVVRMRAGNSKRRVA